MKHKLPSKIFITGTNTGIGKTVVSAILMAGLKGKYWKPIQSGLEETTDTDWVKENTGLPEKHFLPETYRLKRPLSPHTSAALEGVKIELEEFSLPEINDSEHLIIEGAGGLMVPLNDRYFMIDLIKKLDIPVLLVASSALGTINHTLLSLEQMRKYNLDIAGVIMNGSKNIDNRKAIENFGKINVLAEIELMPKINSQILIDGYRDCFK